MKLNVARLRPGSDPACRRRRRLRPAVLHGLLALIGFSWVACLAAAEGSPPAPAPSPAPVATPPAPVPVAAPQDGTNPVPKPKPKPEPKPTPPVLIPDDLPDGQAIVHFWLFDDLTLTKLMIYQEHLYGFEGDELVEFPLDDVKGFEANGKCDILTRTGQLPVAARKALWRDAMFYFQLEDGSHMLTPESRVAAIYPPDRFRIYPWIFNRYIAPWGKLYDQRPFYILVDAAYVQMQNLQRTEWANGRLQTGFELGLWRLKFEATAFYGTVDRVKTTNNQTAEFKLDRYLNAWIYAYIKSGVFHDDINFISYRLTNGIGFGLGTFQQNDIAMYLFDWALKNHRLDIEIGLDRIDEHNRDGYQLGWFGRTAVIDKLQISEAVDFDNRFEYQPGLVSRNQEDRGQYFLHYRSELRLRLFGSISIRVYYNFDYNSRPVEPTPPDSHQIGISFGYRYGM